MTLPDSLRIVAPLMPTVELLELYPSPFSERLRWALDSKGVEYGRRAYTPMQDEDALVRDTGYQTVPVLFADGTVVGDSNVALEWLERSHPNPALLPSEPLARAQVRAWELTATESMGPAARLVMIGQFRDGGVQPLGDHFTQKYGWSPHAQRQADGVLGSLLPDLAAAVASSPYLVGNRFTRADLTVASLLNAILGPPPDALFVLDTGLRGMFGIPFDQAVVERLTAWRDETYRRHRGRQVVPVAA